MVNLRESFSLKRSFPHLTISNQAPDIIILDEPTNNLDIQNIEILTAAINEYKGTLIVISHDEYFLNQINVEHSMVIG
jgi:ATPase subunit of ABC transporter with duplicated ATPase domains